MTGLLKRILLTLIALALLVIVEQAFGMTAALIGAGVCFLGYIFLITVRQMRDEPDDE